MARVEQVLSVVRHRNGIGGAPFDCVVFTHGGQRFVATVFDAADHVAVLRVNDLTGDMTTDEPECWRGHNFERELRAAVRRYQEAR